MPASRMLSESSRRSIPPAAHRACHAPPRLTACRRVSIHSMFTCSVVALRYSLRFCACACVNHWATSTAEFEFASSGCVPASRSVDFSYNVDKVFLGRLQWYTSAAALQSAPGLSFHFDQSFGLNESDSNLPRQPMLLQVSITLPSLESSSSSTRAA